ncbi:hypothetical protein Daus18300_004214 [Diaporthe australafricana]|uniref:Alpha-ketoglutarate-dependent dioxygenase AlkB-like domain-containing protein n=1 Tax=Diaporthe australafricana TaxID=127596 RepID=A0ABR3XAM6_9PEZI
METEDSPARQTEQKGEAQLSYAKTITRKNMESWVALGSPRYFAQRRPDFASATAWFHGTGTGYWSTNQGDPRNGRDETGDEQKYCTGLFLAGRPPAGQYLDPEVVITALNGPENFQTIINSRKKETRHSIDRLVPVGVAVGKEACKPDTNGARTFPCPIPEGLDCVVLGWFLATNMWPQPVKAENGSVRTAWMVRLEKIDLSEPSWWSNAAHKTLRYPSPEERDFKTKASKESCKTCEERSVRIYNSNFVCLNQNCADWFTVDGKLLVQTDPRNITYNPDFLRERFDRFDEALKPEPLEPFYPSLYPSLQQFLAKNFADATTPVTENNIAARNEALLSGFSCPQCGLANPRLQWDRWYCRNVDCRDEKGDIKPFSYHAPPPVVTSELLAAERQLRRPSASKPLDTLLGYKAARDLESHVAHQLDFGGGCRATIFRPKPDSPAITTADDLLAKIQQEADSGNLGLARRSVRGLNGAALTNHFVENFGERYRLPFALGDIPLDQAPGAVNEALQAANGYMKEYFGDDNSDCEFNEVYIAAYMSKKMGMSFHDDGEKGLGSIIATWTLGGRAIFKFCIKPQFDYGRSKQGGGWMRPADGQVDPIPTGCTEETSRKALNARFDSDEITEDEWRTQLQQHMDAYMANPQNRMTYSKRTIVTFAVEHGDIVVMSGPNTQKYMEHSVDCDSPMRFALTFRRVTQNMGTAAQWANLDAKLARDKAFKPSWTAIEANKRKAEDEGEDDGKSAGDAKKSKMGE